MVSRGDKRARTRAALLAAARELIGEGGLAGVSLEAVAARVGMSRGAIYGNFQDRDDLLIAVTQAAAAPIEPPFEPGLTLRRQMRRQGAEVFAVAAARRGQAALAAVFRLYAASRPTLGARVAEETAARLARREAQLLAVYPAMLLPMPAGAFVRAVDALTGGLVSAHLESPDAFPEPVFAATFEALAG